MYKKCIDTQAELSYHDVVFLVGRISDMRPGAHRRKGD